MDGTAKSRRPETNSIIQELEKKYFDLLKDNPTHNIYMNTISKFSTMLENKIQSLCGYQKSEFEKFGRIENEDGVGKVKIFPGQEAEANKALAELSKCTQPLVNYYLGIDAMTKQSHLINSLSTEFCIDDCEINNTTNTEELRKCMDKCYYNNFYYTLKGIEVTLNSQTESVIEEMRKL